MKGATGRFEPRPVAKSRLMRQTRYRLLQKESTDNSVPPGARVVPNEVRIILVRSLEGLDYVRERYALHMRRVGSIRIAANEILIGWSELSPKATGINWSFFRRVFFLRKYDAYSPGRPTEAIDPRSIVVGFRGRRLSPAGGVE
jgi:hypothetical protein